MLPEIRICKGCSRKFNATVESQDECITCLSRPQKHELPIDIEAIETQLKEGTPMPDILKAKRHFPEKICENCQQPYEPTAPRQQFCSACGKKPKISINKALRQELPPLPTQNNAETILGMLIQAGKLSEELVDKCDKFLKSIA